MTRSMINVWVKCECVCVFVSMCLYVRCTCACTRDVVWRMYSHSECNESAIFRIDIGPYALQMPFYLNLNSSSIFVGSRCKSKKMFFVLVWCSTRYGDGKYVCENGAGVKRLYMCWQYALDHCKAEKRFSGIDNAVFKACKRVRVCLRTHISFPTCKSNVFAHLFLLILIKIDGMTITLSTYIPQHSIECIYWLDFTSNMLLNLSHISDGFVTDFIIEREY